MLVVGSNTKPKVVWPPAPGAFALTGMPAATPPGTLEAGAVLPQVVSFRITWRCIFSACRVIGWVPVILSSNAS